MKRVVVVFLAVLASFGLGGCWKDQSSIDQVVWSDDDTGHAYVVLRFEEKSESDPLSSSNERRRYRHQVSVQNADGTERRPVAGVLENRVGPDLYYMRGAGYVMVEVVGDDRLVRFDIVRISSGAVATVASRTLSGAPCEYFQVLPSFDGRTLAVIDRTLEGAADDGRCPPGQVMVEFLDAETLSIIDRYEWSVTDAVETAWTAEGELIVVAPEDGAWSVLPANGATPMDPPDCMYPRTSSSPVSAAGVMIGPGPSADEPVTVLGPVPEGDPYDCR